jgi:hypothetical protein
LQAASEKRTNDPNVFASLKRKGNFLVFKIRNSCSEKMVIDPEKHLPLKKGRTSPGHGIGIRNAADICEKYLGTMEYMQKDDEVIVTGMLQLK